MEVDESTNDDSLLSEDGEKEIKGNTESKIGWDKESGKKTEDGSWEHAYSSNKQSKEKKDADRIRWSRLVASLMDNQDKPLISLTPTTQTQVQDILVEGELLEVSLDETIHLWRVLQAASHPPAMLEDTLLSLNSSSNNGEDIKTKKAAPKKRKSQTEGLDDGQPKSPLKSPKKTKFTKLNLVDGKSSKGLMKKKLLTKPGEKKKREMAPNKDGPRKRNMGAGRKKKVQSASMDDDDDEEDEACAAVKCQHPSGQNVDWVQCDGCEGWFHYICVGLKAGDVHEDEEYMCLNCTTKQPAPKVGGDDSHLF